MGRRFGVAGITAAELAAWQADTSRTTYVFDVRTAAEFEAGHLAGSSHAAGGQLVQATDEYAATRNARIVLVDDDGVRATMTASWLRQLGWDQAVVLGGLPFEGDDPGPARVAAAAAELGAALDTGPTARPDLARVHTPTVRPPELARWLAEEADGLVVIDVGTSVKYRNRGHIPGAWWAVRSRMARPGPPSARPGGSCSPPPTAPWPAWPWPRPRPSGPKPRSSPWPPATRGGATPGSTWRTGSPGPPPSPTTSGTSPTTIPTPCVSTWRST